jgi:hypothetical protein
MIGVQCRNTVWRNIGLRLNFKAEAVQGARATTGLTSMFSIFCPQLISASRPCDQILANSIIPIDRGEEDTYSTRKIPKLAHLHQGRDPISPKNYFAQKSTAWLV